MSDAHAPLVVYRRSWRWWWRRRYYVACWQCDAVVTAPSNDYRAVRQLLEPPCANALSWADAV